MTWYGTGPSGSTLYGAVLLSEEPIVRYLTPDDRPHKMFAGGILFRALKDWLEQEEQDGQTLQSF